MLGSHYVQYSLSLSTSRPSLSLGPHTLHTTSGLCPWNALLSTFFLVPPGHARRRPAPTSCEGACPCCHRPTSIPCGLGDEVVQKANSQRRPLLYLNSQASDCEGVRSHCRIDKTTLAQKRTASSALGSSLHLHCTLTHLRERQGVSCADPRRVLCWPALWAYTYAEGAFGSS